MNEQCKTFKLTGDNLYQVVTVEKILARYKERDCARMLLRMEKRKENTKFFKTAYRPKKPGVRCFSEDMRS